MPRRGDLPVDTGLSHPRFFPPPTATTPDGLLCVGGRLSPEWLLDAYAHGIFPWPIWEHEPMVWWSPDPRAIIELDGFHMSRRLRRTLRSGKFQVTCDRDFEGVIRGCATAPGRGAGNTWLTSAMIAAYCRMHELGHAHSVEVWHEGEAGRRHLWRGGRRIIRGREHVSPCAGCVDGGCRASCGHLRERGYRLLDIQQWTPHTGRLGAIEISRAEYLRRLAAATDCR